MNPYTTPDADLTTPIPEAGYQVLGNQLVCRSGARLPPRCIKTNVPVPESEMIAFATRPGGFTLGTQKKIKITFALSKPAQSKRIVQHAIFWVVFVISLILVVGRYSPPIGITGLVGGLFYLRSFGASPVAVSKVNAAGEFTVGGCCEEFLHSVREYKEAEHA